MPNRRGSVDRLPIWGLDASSTLLLDIFQLHLTLRFVCQRRLYFGLYLRGAMSAVTGIYLFRLLLNIIFFVLRSFFTLKNSAYHDEMPHDGISPVYKCKNHVPKIYFTIEMQPNIFFKVISYSIHVCIHWL